MPDYKIIAKTTCINVIVVCYIVLDVTFKRNINYVTTNGFINGWFIIFDFGLELKFK